MHLKSQSSNKLVPLLAIAACIIWGTPYKLLKLFYNELSISKEALGTDYSGQILVAVSIRFFIAGILVLLFAKFRKQKIFKLNKKQWGQVLLMGLVSTAVSYVFFNIGNVNISSSINSSIIGQSGIFFGVILSCLFYKNEKFTLTKIIAFILGVAGLIISQLDPANPLVNPFGRFTLTGEGFMMIHGVCFAIATMIGRHVSGDLDSFVMTGWNLVTGSIMLCIIGMFMGGSFVSMSWTVPAFGYLLLLAVASAIPFSIWYWCTQYTEISKLSMYKFLIPVSGSVIGILFGEDFTWTLGLALIMVCSSIILISKAD